MYKDQIQESLENGGLGGTRLIFDFCKYGKDFNKRTYVSSSSTASIAAALPSHSLTLPPSCCTHTGTFGQTSRS